IHSSFRSDFTRRNFEKRPFSVRHYLSLNMHVCGMAAEMLENSCYAESVAMTHFYEDDLDSLSSKDLDTRLLDARKITNQVIAMLHTLSEIYAEDAKVQGRITLHNTWYYILGLSFATPKGKPYPLPTLGQARRLTKLVNDSWPAVSKRFPEMFTNRKRPDFESDSPTISRQMRSGYKAGLPLHPKKQP
ncbi:hypothetical protein, partial [Acidithiobacillus thiooxidans]|uniref:hypothetical protein n=1 Tax=Acidithiobacillus thiooxidans TaxID=930 RepID=UPI001C06D3DD